MRRALMAAVGVDDDDDDSASVDDVGIRGSLSRSQLLDVRAVIATCCALSMLGCALILFHYWRSARHIRQAARTSSSSPRAAPASVVPKMIAVLSLVDFCFCLPKVFGVPSGSLDVGAGKALCLTQAFALQFAGLASVFWNVCIAHCLYRKIVRGDSEALLHRRLKFYAIGSVVPPASVSSLLLGAGRFGDSEFYCWVSDRAWQFWCFYLFVILALVYVGVVLLLTHAHILRVGSSQRSVDALESSARITLALRLYVGAFIVLWLPAAVFRLLNNWLGSATFAVAVLMQLTLCLQGLAIAVIYGGLLSRMRQALADTRCCWRGQTDKLAQAEYKRATSPYFPTLESNGDVDGEDMDGLTATGREQSARHPVSIFVSTFNLGEARLTTSDLEKWIPLGYDIYVIGLQECLYLSEARALLRRHIETGGSNDSAGGSQFYMFNREIGSTNTSLGYHGHIAISVCIQVKDVDSGAFYMPPVVRQQVNCGKSLVLGRASNKGAVGVAFRYYDTSFAFVSCHLSSDSKGKSKAQRRNRDLVDLLKGLHLNLEDVGVEFPYLHHHSFVLGDLNYRLADRDASVDGVFDLISSIREGEIASAAKQQQQQLNAEPPQVKKSRWSWTSATSSMKLKRKKKAKADATSELNSRMLSQPLHSAASSVDSFDGNDLGLTAAGSGRDDSVYSTNSALVDDDHRVWDDLLAHDELRNLMRDARVLYGFEEAPIAFPPTYRRVRGATGLTRDPTRPWTRELLEKVYTTAIATHNSQRGGVVYDANGNATTAVDAAQVRVPSYTDRILFRSLPDMRDRLHCSLYTSCEGVSCSDHKPVVGIFHALVDRARLPAESEAAIRKIELMEHLPGVRECALRVSFTDMTWDDPAPTHDVGLARSSATTSAGDERPLLFFDRRASQAFVTVVFPLPSEDVFSAQRRLHELADAVSGGGFLGGSSSIGRASGGSSSVVSTSSTASSASSSHGDAQRRARRQSSMNSAAIGNAVTARWPRFVREGVAHTTLARPMAGGMHVAVKVHAGAGQREFGQGVICVPLPAREANSSSVRRDFIVELADGGRRTATLRGSVSLRVSTLSSALGGDGDDGDVSLSMVDELHVLDEELLGMDEEPEVEPLYSVA